MSKKVITYLASFGKLGYYANSQPDYNWSFTNDVNNAKEYKTLRGVLDRIFYYSPDYDHKYGSTDRFLVEKHSIIVMNGNNINITNTFITKTFEETVELFKHNEDLKREIKIEKFNKQQEKDDKIYEKERIKWDKILKDKIEKEDTIYKPKCIEIQNELNHSNYVEKRNKFILKDNDDANFTTFYTLSNSDNCSKYLSLIKFFTTMKILFDNNKFFILSDYKIKIKNDDMEDIRKIFIENGVFNKNFCILEQTQ